MKIPTELLEKWQVLRSAGDSQKIIDTMETKVSDSTISNAFKTGQCSDELFEAMAEYYQGKKERISKYHTAA